MRGAMLSFLTGDMFGWTFWTRNCKPLAATLQVGHHGCTLYRLSLWNGGKRKVRISLNFVSNFSIIIKFTCVKNLIVD